jgi:hypothetical protein
MRHKHLLPGSFSHHSGSSYEPHALTISASHQFPHGINVRLGTLSNTKKVRAANRRLSNNGAKRMMKATKLHRLRPF